MPAVLLPAMAAMVRLTAWLPLVGWWFNGGPTLLSRHGAYDQKALRWPALSPDDADQVNLEQGGDAFRDTRRGPSN